MFKNHIYQNYTYILIISSYSFSINYFFANIGAFPIDTFAFFDTAYNIVIGRHPFKDYWITTGPLVDYLQALFFIIFGSDWKSYVIHGSLVNTIVSLFFYLTLILLGFKKTYSFVYSLLLGTLIYTISGTPFAYIHSYALSLLSILTFTLAINKDSEKAFFALPICMILSFFSMQNPSTLINILLIISTLFYCLNYKKFKLLGNFIFGSVASLILIFCFFYLTKINFKDFIEQYILFPLSIGSNRVTNNELAHFGLSDRLTFRGVVGHFKFIHLYLFSLLLISTYLFKKRNISRQLFISNLVIILSGFLLIFNQLITSNQTYIFSFIPFISAFFHFTLLKYKNTSYLNILMFFLAILFTLKYHFTYNIERKFHDLHNLDLKEAKPASLIDKKLNGLKWITPEFPLTPEKEMNNIKEIIQILKKDKSNKMVLTHYQFLTVVIDENLNIPNRWYTNDGNSYPLKGSKYFQFYKKHLTDLLDKNKIQNIYLIGDRNFDDFFLMFFDNSCYEKKIINELSKIYKPKKC